MRALEFIVLPYALSGFCVGFVVGLTGVGRKPILTPHQQKEARKRLEAGDTQRSVARSYNVSQSTISRLIV